MEERQDTPREEIPEETEVAETERTETEGTDAAEAVETEEKVEERTLEDATHEPGARVEESQGFEQAEAVESELKEAVESTPDESSPDVPQEAAGTPEVWDDRAEQGGGTYSAKPGVPEGDSGWLGTGGDDPVLAEPTPADVVEVPDGIEIKPASEDDGTVGWDDHPVEEEPALSTTPGESKEDEYYVDARVVIRSEAGDQGGQVELDHPGTGGRVAQEPEPGPEPSLSPVFDGNIGEDPDPGGTPPMPDVGESESEGDLPVAEDESPDGRRETESEDGLPAYDDVPEGGRDSQMAGELLGEDAQEPKPEKGVLPATDGEVQEEKQEGVREDDETDEPPDWYLHEDKDGNITVVDKDGNPVDSPPVVYKYQGKTYVAYPGDEPAIAPDGTVNDPSKLIELPNYKKPIKDMYLHEDKDGNITVVDKDGKPVSSPPVVFKYQGKTYVTYGESPIAADGTIKDPSKLIELSTYKQDTKNMYLHEDKDGKITVVDGNGKPVDSPPIVYTYKGKTYVSYPGDEPFNPDGTIKDPSKLIELSDYKPAIRDISKEMYLHEDKDGNITVVDVNGKPVDSPPVVYTYQGKIYVTYPGDEPAIAPDGTIKDPSKLIELSTYKTAIKDMYLHEDKDGNITVVDGDGKPVNSPPIVFTYQGKTYVTYPGDDPINPDGTIKDPSKLIELSTYKAPIKDMYLHEDKDGNVTVVGKDGKPVDSPPIVFSYKGKYYAAYPGDDPINPDGTIKDPSKLIELSNYKPPGWGQKTT